MRAGRHARPRQSPAARRARAARLRAQDCRSSHRSWSPPRADRRSSPPSNDGEGVRLPGSGRTTTSTAARMNDLAGFRVQRAARRGRLRSRRRRSPVTRSRPLPAGATAFASSDTDVDAGGPLRVPGVLVHRGRLRQPPRTSSRSCARCLRPYAEHPQPATVHDRRPTRVEGALFVSYRVLAVGRPRRSTRTAMSQLPFTKMHGIGNDYVYVDCFTQQVADPAASGAARQPAPHRHRRRTA